MPARSSAQESGLKRGAIVLVCPNLKDKIDALHNCDSHGYPLLVVCVAVPMFGRTDSARTLTEDCWIGWRRANLHHDAPDALSPLVAVRWKAQTAGARIVSESKGR